MTPRLEACYFLSPDHDARTDIQMQRCARVLEHSARAHCPTWTVNVVLLPPEPRQDCGGSAADHANSRKLAHWCALVNQAADGEQFLLMDVDTFVTRPLDALWALPFDLAYTVRNQYRSPLNGGVVALRVSPAIRVFIQRWADEDKRMLRAHAYRAPWRRRYGGQNQAALGKLLEEDYRSPHQHSLFFAALPCVEWNCEESAWAQFNPSLTRIVHVKSRLRRAVFDSRVRSGLEAIVERWRAVERAATESARPHAARA